jgi:hypothetical protein
MVGNSIKFGVYCGRVTSLYIFLDEAKKNNDAIGYDDFAEELWRRLKKDVNHYPKEANDFTCTWAAWVDLHQYLKKNDKLK